MYGKLNMADNVYVAFWAACVVAFFTFFRKSTLLPETVRHNCSIELCRSYAKFQTDHVIITVKHSKTIQFGERSIDIPVARVRDSPLCPVKAMTALWRAGPHIPQHAAMFSYALPSTRTYVPLTQPYFVRILRETLSSCGFQANQYSGHSFRWGGATFALASGVPVEAIKAQGDWKSHVVERYLSPSLKYRHTLSKTVAAALSE